MARKCFMCGRELAEGILCEKCDKPRRKAPTATAAPKPDPPAEQPPARTGPELPPFSPAASPARSRPSIGEPGAATAQQLQQEPFPKAPVVPFRFESASLAITSVVNLLDASGVAAVLVGPDRQVKFVSDEAKRLLDAPQSELMSIAAIESKTAVRVGDLAIPASTGVRIGRRNFIYNLVPMSGGAGGAVMVFRHTDPGSESHASFVTYVRETVLGPLKSLRDSLRAAGRTREDALLIDSAAGVDQVLSSLELAPEIEEPFSGARPIPTVTDVIRRVAERYRAHADLKGVRLDVDLQELDDRFSDHEQLAESLSILMENALHYVPSGGQVVLGVRWMEHKAKPLLLFFVMDSGPVVPESLRQVIFEPSFVWKPAASERTGRGLFKCREFAIAHAGSLWVESKTGKACTFFLRVRPDGFQ